MIDGFLCAVAGVAQGGQRGDALPGDEVRALERVGLRRRLLQHGLRRLGAGVDVIEYRPVLFEARWDRFPRRLRVLEGLSGRAEGADLVYEDGDNACRGHILEEGQLHLFRLDIGLEADLLLSVELL